MLATNTSSLPVTEIAVATSNPKRVVGMHFFNPAPVQQFVEVDPHRRSPTDDVFEDVKALAERLGKKPVVVGDKAGFIANALLFGYLNHAVSMFESRYATREDIDAAMRFGCGYPMGPLALLDLIGLDTAYEILDTMYKQGRDRLHAPSPIIKQMVSAGLLGRKSGRGFYTYAEPGLARGRRRRRRPPPAAAGRGVAAPGRRRWASSGRAPWRPASSRCSPRPGSTSSTSPAADAKVERSAPRCQEPREGRAARQADRGGRATSAARPPDRHHLAGGPGRRRPRRRGGRRGPRGQAGPLRDLDEICKPGAILATTTSSLPVVDCAAATTRPAGRHRDALLQPRAVMKLVEVVHTVSTAPDVTATVRELCAAVGKLAVTCGDRSGFIVNALLFPYLNDAVRMLEAQLRHAPTTSTPR